MRKLIAITETYKGTGLYPGTKKVLEELDKKGIIKILNFELYEEIETYDDMEGYELYSENIIVEIMEPESEEINRSGYDFVGMMLNGLGLKTF